MRVGHVKRPCLSLQYSCKCIVKSGLGLTPGITVLTKRKSARNNDRVAGKRDIEGMQADRKEKRARE